MKAMNPRGRATRWTSPATTPAADGGHPPSASCDAIPRGAHRQRRPTLDADLRGDAAPHASVAATATAATVHAISQDRKRRWGEEPDRKIVKPGKLRYSPAAVRSSALSR